MGLLLAKQKVWLRNILIKDAPDEFYAVSPSASVPTLVLDHRPESLNVIDQSLDIMVWALRRNDPDNLLLDGQPQQAAMFELLKCNDDIYIDWLEKYKFAARHKDMAEIFYRQNYQVLIDELEQRLNRQRHFMGATPSLADYALLPYIRQFARVDKKWYRQAPYPKLRQWLNNHLQSRLFSKTMTHYPLWPSDRKDQVFGDKT